MFHSLWLKHGINPFGTFELAVNMNIHISVTYVTVEQLYNDTNYLYSALKQALKLREGDLVVKQ